MVLSPKFFELSVSCGHIKACSNVHLQRDLSKSGLENFEFIIIEFVSDVNVLLTMEQKWLNWLFDLSRDSRYNLAPDAVAPMLGRNHSEESKVQRTFVLLKWVIFMVLEITIMLVLLMFII